MARFWDDIEMRVRIRRISTKRDKQDSIPVVGEERKSFLALSLLLPLIEYK